jgi:membrane protease YdiL (CAAX protease family)
MVDFFMIKKALRFVLRLLPIALITGLFLGIWTLDMLPVNQIEMALAKVGSRKNFILLTALRTIIRATFCGFLGYLLANKVGLWKPIKFEKKKLTMTLVISFLGGLLLSLDPWTFGKFINIPIQQNNISAIAFIASILYGGIIEELMLRLFFMSLIIWILQKLFFRKQDQIPQKVFIISNIISALVFAAGHLPMTIELFGSLTPIIIFRCFLFNGGFGLIFGWFYRKYGIHYAMLSHAMLHLVSKMIWLCFI